MFVIGSVRFRFSLDECLLFTFIFKNSSCVLIFIDFFFFFKRAVHFHGTESVLFIFCNKVRRYFSFSVMLVSINSNSASAFAWEGLTLSPLSITGTLAICGHK